MADHVADNAEAVRFNVSLNRCGDVTDAITDLRLADSEIERLTKAPIGLTGPVGLGPLRLIADHAVMGVVNGVTGANKAETHLINVNPGRDFSPALVEDVVVDVYGQKMHV